MAFAELMASAMQNQQPQIKVTDLNQLGGRKEAYLDNVMAVSNMGAGMAKFAPWGMAIESITNLGMGIWNAINQSDIIGAQIDYMEHMKELQTQSLTAEITHRSELLKAQKEIAGLTATTTERLAQIQSKKEIKLAEIASDTKKALYNTQARQQLFLRTRFYGNPAKAA